MWLLALLRLTTVNSFALLDGVAFRWCLVVGINDLGGILDAFTTARFLISFLLCSELPIPDNQFFEKPHLISQFTLEEVQNYPLHPKHISKESLSLAAWFR